MPPAVKTQSAVSQTFGLLFGVIGLINMGWGNDFFYGLFVLSLSLLYFPFASSLLSKYLKPTLILILKIAVGLFILWSSLGVGELFHKIDMMRASF